jgi:hypothetical protein
LDLSFLLGRSLWTACYQHALAHTVLNAYIGFVSVIAMWSWHRDGVSSPGPAAQASGHGGRLNGLNLRQRFMRSLQVLLHHELALIFNFGVLVAMQQGRATTWPCVLLRCCGARA